MSTTINAQPLTDAQVTSAFDEVTVLAREGNDPFSEQFHKLTLAYVLAVHHAQPLMDAEVCSCGCGAVADGDIVAKRATVYATRVIFGAVHNGLMQQMHGDPKEKVKADILWSLEEAKAAGEDPIDTEEALNAFIAAAEFGWDIGEDRPEGMLKAIHARVQAAMQDDLGDMMEAIFGSNDEADFTEADIPNIVPFETKTVH